MVACRHWGKEPLCLGRRGVIGLQFRAKLRKTDDSRKTGPGKQVLTSLDVYGTLTYRSPIALGLLGVKGFRGKTTRE